MQTEFRIFEVEADKVSEDQPLQVKLSDQAAIALYVVEGEYYAIDDVCTHEFAFLSEGYCENGVIECPLHQARFDVRTGETLGPPASVCLASYRTEVHDGVVRIFVPLGLCGKSS
jgi:nitrite reductase/ring-hydroxylating ferredoxin subunit